MIIVRFSSGLGNQMYQYNFYRFIKEKYKNTSVKVDLTWFYANNDHHGYELERVFGRDKLGIDVASKKEILSVTGQIPPLIRGPLAGKLVYLLGPVNRIMREHAKVDKGIYHIDQLGGEISNKDIISDKGEQFNPMYEKVTHLDEDKDWYITGFWIEEKYYRDRLDRLTSELSFPQLRDDKNISMLKDIHSSNSVSIHVRRGDYLSATYSSMFKCLGREYYESAVEYIKTRVEKPRFFIFSDDSDYIREAFEWLDNKVIVDHNVGDDSFRDMQLMSACKHNIIANSTFSQWGALLNQNSNHITVYPIAYLSDEDSEVKTISGWVRM